jgi:hypothetical protein
MHVCRLWNKLIKDTQTFWNTIAIGWIGSPRFGKDYFNVRICGHVR